MTLSSSHQSPSPIGNTPTPSTAQLAEIRHGIEPKAGWWQFDFQPWHYWTAIASAAVIAAAFVALIIETGAVR